MNVFFERRSAQKRLSLPKALRQMTRACTAPVGARVTSGFIEHWEWRALLRTKLKVGEAPGMDESN